MCTVCYTIANYFNYFIISSIESLNIYFNLSRAGLSLQTCFYDSSSGMSLEEFNNHGSCRIVNSKI